MQCIITVHPRSCCWNASTLKRLRPCLPLLSLLPCRNALVLSQPFFVLVRFAICCAIADTPSAALHMCTAWIELRPVNLRLPQQLDCELSRPFPRSRFISGSIGLVHVSNFRDERIIRVGICEHRADGEQDFRYCQSRAPLVSWNVQTYAAVRVDVGMVDSGGEVDFRRLEGVVCWEVDG